MLAFVALLTGSTGCADSSPHAERHVTHARATKKPVPPHTSPPTRSGRDLSLATDNDKDGDGGNDDLGWGHPASPTDTLAVTQQIEAFYAAAAADDGKKACQLMLSLFAEEIPELYGEGSGSSYMRGTTCVQVLDGLYEHERRALRAEVPLLKITHVRIRGLRGLVMLSFGKRAEREITVRREHGIWKVSTLIDSPLG